jgi:hypothetical protein
VFDDDEIKGVFCLDEGLDDDKSGETG